MAQLSDGNPLVHRLQLFLIAGPPGSGKSSLIQEFKSSHQSLSESEIIEVDDLIQNTSATFSPDAWHAARSDAHHRCFTSLHQYFRSPPPAAQRSAGWTWTMGIVDNFHLLSMRRRYLVTFRDALQNWIAQVPAELARRTYVAADFVEICVTASIDTCVLRNESRLGNPSYIPPAVIRRLHSSLLDWPVHPPRAVTAWMRHSSRTVNTDILDVVSASSEVGLLLQCNATPQHLVCCGDVQEAWCESKSAYSIKTNQDIHSRCTVAHKLDLVLRKVITKLIRQSPKRGKELATLAVSCSKVKEVLLHGASHSEIAVNANHMTIAAWNAFVQCVKPLTHENLLDDYTFEELCGKFVSLVELFEETTNE